jgi:hypothetical protein
LRCAAIRAPARSARKNAPKNPAGTRAKKVGFSLARKNKSR